MSNPRRHAVVRCRTTGKVRFPSEAAARAALGRIIDAPRTRRIPNRVYDEPCRHCDGWHLSSHVKTADRKRARRHRR